MKSPSKKSPKKSWQAQMKEDLDDVRARLEEREEELDNVNELQEVVEDELYNTQAELEDVSERLEEREEDLDDVSARLEEREEELDDVNELQEEAEDELYNTQAELEEVKGDLRVAQQKLDRNREIAVYGTVAFCNFIAALSTSNILFYTAGAVCAANVIYNLHKGETVLNSVGKNLAVMAGTSALPYAVNLGCRVPGISYACSLTAPLVQKFAEKVTETITEARIRGG